jgi:hypothetical protein
VATRVLFVPFSIRNVFIVGYRKLKLKGKKVDDKSINN